MSLLLLLLIPCPLDDAAFNRMKTAVNLLEDSLSYGIDINYVPDHWKLLITSQYLL